MSDGEIPMENRRSVSRAPSAKPSKTSSNGKDSDRSSRSNGARREFGSPKGAMPSGGATRPFFADKKGQAATVPKAARTLPDKRPPPRNVASANGRFRNKVALETPEVGSVGRPPWRKGELAADQLFGDPSWIRHKYAGGHHAPQPCFNKERYLQANCQFVVSEGSDYGVYLADPDLLVDWDKIQEVRLGSEEAWSCPICLYPPVAAQMTRCGHVFCYACLLHYLALSDRRWRKCPICYEAVYADQLKSVTAKPLRKLALGDAVRMRLMKKERGSTLVSPAAVRDDRNGPMRRLDDELGGRYCKLLVASVEEVRRAVIARERQELERQWEIDRAEPEAIFITQALDRVHDREENLVRSLAEDNFGGENAVAREMYVYSVRVSSDEASPPNVTVFEDAFNDRTVSESPPSAAAEAAEGDMGEELAEALDALQNEVLEEVRELIVAPDDNAHVVHFYQMDDGQCVYLNPLNARCLIREYGGLADAPDYVEGRLVQLDRLVMTEAVRRRFRYLGHLPLTAGFALAELRLDRHLLSKETYMQFAEEIAKRKQLRQKRARDERRRDFHAQQWGRALLMQPERYGARSMSEGSDPPDIPFVTYVASAQRDIQAAITHPAPAERGAPLIPEEARDDADNANLTSVPSFAEMLRLGKPKQLASNNSSAKKDGQSSAGKRQETASVGENAPSDDDQEPSLPAPSFHDAFGEALQAAFANLNTHQDLANETTPKGGQETGKGKKKKKAKGTLLFSTGMAAPGLH